MSTITELNRDTVDQVRTRIIKAAEDVHGAGFADGHLGAGKFGQSTKSAQLTTEYDLSFTVVKATLRGFEEDLDGFAEAVKRAGDNLGTTDDDVTEMLTRIGNIVPTENDSRRHDDAWRATRGEGV